MGVRAPELLLCRSSRILKEWIFGEGEGVQRAFPGQQRRRARARKHPIEVERF